MNKLGQTWELCRSVANMMMEYANTYAASALVKISSLQWTWLNMWRGMDKDACMLSTRPERIEFDILKNFTKKKLYGPFLLWMGFNCLKATATSRRQFTFYNSVPRNPWYSFYRPRKDERLSRPWSHPVVLITGHLDWESSANFSQNHPQACFLYWISFHEHSQFTGHQGKVEAFSLTPLYHFPPFHRHFDISRVITTGSSLLRIAANRSRTGNNIWFPSASRSPLSYAPLKTLNEKGSIFKRLSFNLWESSPRSIYLFRRRKYAESQLWWHS